MLKSFGFERVGMMAGVSIALLAFVLMFSALVEAQDSEPQKEQPPATAAAESQPHEQQTEQQSAPPASEPQASVTEEAQSATPVITAQKPQFKVNWTNQFKQSNMFRVSSPDPLLYDPGRNLTNLFLSDGEHSFPHRGLVSARADLLTEMDVSYGDWGIRASAAGWLDPVYNRRLHPNTSVVPQAYASGIAVDGTHFSQSDAFQEIQFRNFELLDAFMFGKVKLGTDTFLSFRAGQFAQVWGQTLFYGMNGIAGAMVPIDTVKALGVPNSTTKEIMRPVPQVSVQVDFGPKLSVAGYYQFMWKETRLPGVGSYFDFGSILFPGASRFVVPAPSDVPPFSLGPQPYPYNTFFALYRDKDVSPPDGGQFGGQILIKGPKSSDIGFHFAHYTDKGPLINQCIMCANIAHPSYMDIPGYFGTYYLSYQHNVNAFAVSATKTIGMTNYALEVGAHTHQALVGDPVSQTTPYATGGHAVGDSVSVNFSTITQFNPNKFCKETTLTAELAFNNLVSITKNASNMDPVDKRQSLAFQGIYGMTYRQVLHGLDLMPQLGFSYVPLGKGGGMTFGPERSGALTPSVTFAYRDAWRASVTYNWFYGPTAPMLVMMPNGIPRLSASQYFHDRNFIAISIYRSIGKTYTSKGR